MKQFTPFADSKILLLAASFIVLLSSIAIIIYPVIQYAHGLFIYPIDDSYVHMAIAKNLVAHQTWGISGEEFSAASSSILYPLLLALFFKIFGVQAIIPLIINIIAAIMLLTAVHRWMQKQTIGTSAQGYILAVLLFFIPLPTLVISGMEHTLQCLFCFLLVTAFFNWFTDHSQSNQTKWKMPISLYVYGILVVSIRYEGLFIVFILSLFLLYLKKIRLLLGFCLISLLPMILFGAFSLAKGGYFFPTSVLFKSGLAFFSREWIHEFFATKLWDKIFSQDLNVNGTATQHLLLILPLVYLIFMNQFKQNGRYRYILQTLIGVSFLQVVFGASGRYARYESYLVCMVAVITGVLFAKFGKEIGLKKDLDKRLVAAVAALIFLFPLISRSVIAFKYTGPSCKNIYDQPYQLGMFLKQYYNNDAVVLHEIGAVSYLSKGNLLDLTGVGNMSIAKARENYRDTPDFLDSLTTARNVKLAIINDHYFNSIVTEKWSKIASWSISGNVSLESDTLSIYSISPKEVLSVRENLTSFEKVLPAGVAIQYY